MKEWHSQVKMKNLNNLDHLLGMHRLAARKNKESNIFNFDYNENGGTLQTQ